MCNEEVVRITLRIAWVCASAAVWIAFCCVLRLSASSSTAEDGTPSLAMALDMVRTSTGAPDSTTYGARPASHARVAPASRLLSIL